MKLYYSPGACSLAPHILLREAGLSFDLERVDLRTKKTAAGEDFLRINPKGYVPALALDNGSVLTEVAVISQYLADQAPAAHLLPASGMARYRALEWLNFIATEIHKGFGPLWNPAMPEEAKNLARARLGERLAFVNVALQGAPYLPGPAFSAPDAYLYVMLNWCGLQKIDLVSWPALADYHARLAARPSVQAALQAEGLER